MKPKIVKDSGWDKKLLDMLDEQTLVVGLREANGGRTDTELSNPEIGSFHEFGLGVPERSFLRSTFDEKEGSYRNILSKLATRTAKQLKGNIPLELLGLKVEADVKNKIRSNIPPPLSEATLARKKGKNVALIDTTQLIESIDYEVR